MKIKILKPVTGEYRVGVAPGKETDLPAELALRMIASGHAEAVEKKTATANKETATEKTATESRSTPTPSKKKKRGKK